uniref:cytochrome c553 n=1 Tax=Glaucosphaera vacuolata TaxID=38265 RepID=UPI001FCCD19D|nr:cytochrome c553 [Glaucosphaera vacuolata]UNJ18692.1 cytochrome c553 [Glaucosphaera vacuolata]
MKKLLSSALIIFGIFSCSTFVFAEVDLDHGAQIFSANCSACHAGGNNVINPERTLKKEALEQYGMKSVEAITNQVTNGKNAMPAFGGRLSSSDIEDVANYVLSQTEKGW